MTTCFECGEVDGLHNHHVVPRLLGGTKTVPLCESCHGKVHGVNFTNHSLLTVKGLQKAKANGVRLGRPIATKTNSIVQEQKQQGLSQSKTATKLGLGIATVKRHWRTIET